MEIKVLKAILFILTISLVIMAKASAIEINLSEMTIEEKIRQMIIIPANSYYGKDVGGVFFGTANKLNSTLDYRNEIDDLQKKSRIKLFVSADMEGYWNPFENFYPSKSFGDIKNNSEAYSLGKEHGKIMNEMGFNLDFSPVVETKNTVWPGRSFEGDKEEIKSKIKAYIEGLHEKNVLATAKHYPGGSMIKNPHWKKYKAEIFQEDLDIFDHSIKSDVDAIMIGHPIVYGAIDSNGKPSSVSKEVITPLRKKFEGIIISDAITMIGLRINYIGRFDEIYIDLIKAGNDMIIDTPFLLPFSSTEKKIEKRVNKVVRAIKKGDITEERINESVKRILQAKGYIIKT